MSMVIPQQGPNRTSGQVGGNASATGIGYGAPVRQAQTGKQDAFQKLAMLRILQGGQHDKLSNDLQDQIQQYQYSLIYVST